MLDTGYFKKVGDPLERGVQGAAFLVDADRRYTDTTLCPKFGKVRARFENGYADTEYRST